MGEEKTQFLNSLDLTPREERQYNRIVKTIQRKLYTNAQCNAYYEKILTSDKYSYNVKQKAVLWKCDLTPSRLWGFRNLSGEALFLFVVENINNFDIKNISVKDMQALVDNPAFIESDGKDFDVVYEVIYMRFGVSTQSEVQFRKTLIAGAVLSNNMSLGLAETILEMREPFHTSDLVKRWHLDEEPLLNWVRETYGFGEVSDSWVHNFLSRSDHDSNN